MFSFAFCANSINFACVFIEAIMSSKIAGLWGLLARYKYPITIVVGVAIVGFIDDNSLMKRLQYDLQISEMKDEIRKYNIQNEQSVRALDELRRNPKAIEKIARERYFMKADDEDIYVLSTDQEIADRKQAKSNEINETVD